jgi:hypothetical protein
MTVELLEQRLHELAIETPDAGRVSARVLARTARRPSRRLPRLTAGAVATLALIALVAYFVPAADTALAGVPVAGDLLRDAGLVNASGRITSVGSVSTSSGYRVTLVGAYADSTRTVLLLHSDPPMYPDFGLGMRLTDQFGRSYNPQNGTGNLDTGDIVVQFEALAWPDAITGARITLHISSIQASVPNGPLIAGSWTLPATLGIDETKALPLPAPATLGPARFRFTSAGYSAATIGIEIEVTGATMTELGRIIPDGGKGTPAFRMDLIDPNGQVISGSGSMSEDPSGVHVSLLGFRLGGGGNYVLRVSYAGFGEFERTLTIPA